MDGPIKWISTLTVIALAGVIYLSVRWTDPDTARDETPFPTYRQLSLSGGTDIGWTPNFTDLRATPDSLPRHELSVADVLFRGSRSANELRADVEQKLLDFTDAFARIPDDPFAGPVQPRPDDEKPVPLPKWFVSLDTNNDGQIGLYEWRLAGRPSDEFLRLDLSGDGLLTPREFRRFLKANPNSPYQKDELPPIDDQRK
jgi:hypothetical protein